MEYHNGCRCGSFFNPQGIESVVPPGEEFKFQGNVIHNGKIVPYYKTGPSNSEEDKKTTDGKEHGPDFGN